MISTVFLVGVVNKALLATKSKRTWCSLASPVFRVANVHLKFLLMNYKSRDASIHGRKTADTCQESTRV